MRFLVVILSMVFLSACGGSRGEKSRNIDGNYISFSQSAEKGKPEIVNIYSIHNGKMMVARVDQSANKMYSEANTYKVKGVEVTITNKHSFCSDESTGSQTFRVMVKPDSIRIIGDSRDETLLRLSFDEFKSLYNDRMVTYDFVCDVEKGTLIKESPQDMHRKLTQYLKQ